MAPQELDPVGPAVPSAVCPGEVSGDEARPDLEVPAPPAGSPVPVAAEPAAAGTGPTQLSLTPTQLQILVDNSPDLIGWYDRDGRRLFVNKALADAHRRSPEELVGTRLTDPRPWPATGVHRPVSDWCPGGVRPGQAGRAEGHPRP